MDAKKLVMSKYTILSNKPVATNFHGEWMELDYELPFWFRNWNKNKIVKVYGCSFAYLDSKQDDFGNNHPFLSDKYQNQFISVHSNLAREDTSSLISKLITERSEEGILKRYEYDPEDDLEVIQDYMMICNNFYTPKIYDLTNTPMDSVRVWFKDSYGERIPIITAHDDSHDAEKFGINQAVFNIEVELAILE
jgi:hypothetical protein